MLVLSQFHRSVLPLHLRTSTAENTASDRAVVMPNALNADYFQDGNNSNDMFVFARYGEVRCFCGKKYLRSLGRECLS